MYCAILEDEHKKTGPSLKVTWSFTGYFILSALLLTRGTDIKTVFEHAMFTEFLESWMYFVIAENQNI